MIAFTEDSAFNGRWDWIGFEWRSFTTRTQTVTPAMKSPSDLPWWTPLPAPVLWGVLASWIPLSIPIMTGLAVGTAAYVGLNVLLERKAAEESTQNC